MPSLESKERIAREAIDDVIKPDVIITGVKQNISRKKINKLTIKEKANNYLAYKFTEPVKI